MHGIADNFNAIRSLAKAHTALAMCQASQMSGDGSEAGSAQIAWFVRFHEAQAQKAFQMALASGHELGRDALGRHHVADGLGRMQPFHDLLKFWSQT